MTFALREIRSSVDSAPAQWWGGSQLDQFDIAVFPR